MRVLDGSKSSIISIHALLAESDVRLYRLSLIALPISIHALLAESDRQTYHQCQKDCRFLSTLSLRRATACITITIICTVLFLSTLSLRRATHYSLNLPSKPIISIHALLAESDHSVRPETRRHDVISIHALLAESDSKSAQNSGVLLRI